MCVANIHVTIQPCSHRWYQLVKPCSESTNLASCSRKLSLQGWETKNQDCPWCSSPSTTFADVNDSTHRLFAGMSPPSTTSRRKSECSSGSSTSPSRGRPIRSTGSSTNASRASSQDNDVEAKELDRAEKNRMMNKRLETYIMMNPARAFGDRADSDLPPVSAASIQRPSLSRNDSIVSKGWKKSVNMSKNMFR